MVFITINENVLKMYDVRVYPAIERKNLSESKCTLLLIV